MEITFWGVRGSIPTPLTPVQVQQKINAVVQRIKPSDLKTADSKQKFLSKLPSWIYGTVGGNTACVEIKSQKGTNLIFDAGSGIRVLGKSPQHAKDTQCNILLSHFHWDHIQGLPFFDKAYVPTCKIDIYSPFEKQHELLADQMHGQYYPVEFDASFKTLTFHKVSPKEPFKIGDLDISCMKMRHPGGSYSYCIKENGKKFIYATDAELTNEDFERTQEKQDFFGMADMIIFDAQYTLDEALHKENWGHSSFSHCIDFASLWDIKKIFLFHHDPTYDDKKLDTVFDAAKKYIGYSGNGKIEVCMATEGLTVTL